jgi:ABC-type Na+ efflux pump permease subunit
MGKENTMIPILRLVVFGFLLLSALYVLVSIYSRSVRREKLEKAYDSGEATKDMPDDVKPDRASYIEGGMVAYQKGLRRQLIWLVYIIPTVVVLVTVYLVNWQ